MKKGDSMNNYNGNYNGYEFNQNPYSASSSRQGISLADYSRRVYAWMASGLAVTFIISFFITNYLNRLVLDGKFEQLETYSGVFLIVALVEVALVFVLGFFIYKLPPTVSIVLFYAYAVCNGITIAPTLFIYGMTSVFYAFAATALLFGSISIYGFLTKRDLTKLGPILMIGLFVLIIYSIFAMIFRMPMSDLVISLIGIALFIGFTAYDTQKIKKGYEYFSNTSDMVQRSSITIALQLYLDFINLFLYLLRLLNRER